MNPLLDILLFLLLNIYYVLESIVKTFIPRSWRAKDVADDIVLITGGGSGIGQQMAIRFANLGATVVVWDISKQGNAETRRLVSEAGGKIFTYECDLSKRNEIYKMADRTKQEVGTVTILINNAGIVTGKPLLESPDHKIQQTFDVNIMAHFWMTKAFLPDMIACNKGHIVTIASLAGLIGVNMLVDYCASKHAAVGFDESLHIELRAGGVENIYTTVVCPYFIGTGMFEGAKSRLFPIMTPANVADIIVAGVLANERMLIIPRYFYFSVILKTVFPWKTYLRLIESVLQVHKSMGTFQGRKEQLKQS